MSAVPTPAWDLRSGDIVREYDDNFDRHADAEVYEVENHDNYRTGIAVRLLTSGVEGVVQTYSERCFMVIA